MAGAVRVMAARNGGGKRQQDEDTENAFHENLPLTAGCNVVSSGRFDGMENAADCSIFPLVNTREKYNHIVTVSPDHIGKTGQCAADLLWPFLFSACS